MNAPTKEELDEAIADLQRKLALEGSLKYGYSNREKRVIITSLTILTKYRDGQLV